MKKKETYKLKLPLEKDWLPLHENLIYSRDPNIVPLYPGEFTIRSEENQIEVYKKCLNFAEEKVLNPEEIQGDIPRNYRLFKFTADVKSEPLLEQLYNELKSGSGRFECIVDRLDRLSFGNPSEFSFYGSEYLYRELYDMFYKSSEALDAELEARGEEPRYSSTKIKVETQWDSTKYVKKHPKPQIEQRPGIVLDDYFLSQEPRLKYLRPLTCVFECEAQEENRVYQKELRESGIIIKGSEAPKKRPKKRFSVVETYFLSEILSQICRYLDPEKPYHTKVRVEFNPEGERKQKVIKRTYTACPKKMAENFYCLSRKIKKTYQ